MIFNPVYVKKGGVVVDTLEVKGTNPHGAYSVSYNDQEVSPGQDVAYTGGPITELFGSFVAVEVVENKIVVTCG